VSNEQTLTAEEADLLADFRLLGPEQRAAVGRAMHGGLTDAALVAAIDQTIYDLEVFSHHFEKIRQRLQDARNRAAPG
jgi:hypothetical protein